MSSNFISEKYWEESGNRRRFFDDFAVAKGFDSLVPDSWYNIARDDLIEHVYTLFPSLLCLSPPSFLFTLPLPSLPCFFAHTYKIGRTISAALLQ